MHHASTSGVYQPCGFDMMHGCSTDELVASAAFIHHDDNGYSFKQYAVLKGLIKVWVSSHEPHKSIRYQTTHTYITDNNINNLYLQAAAPFVLAPFGASVKGKN